MLIHTKFLLTHSLGYILQWVVHIICVNLILLLKIMSKMFVYM